MALEVPERNARIGARCTVAKMLDTLTDPKNHEYMTKVMDDTTGKAISPADAAAQAAAVGYPLSPAIVRRHRRRLTGHGEKCWCPK
jgi:hypothetical protein